MKQSVILCRHIILMERLLFSWTKKQVWTFILLWLHSMLSWSDRCFVSIGDVEYFMVFYGGKNLRTLSKPPTLVCWPPPSHIILMAWVKPENEQNHIGLPAAKKFSWWAHKNIFSWKVMLFFKIILNVACFSNSECVDFNIFVDF